MSIVSAFCLNHRGRGRARTILQYTNTQLCKHKHKYSIQIHNYVSNKYTKRDTWPHTNNHTINTIINWVQSGSCSIYSVCFPFSPCNTMLLSLYTYCIRLPIHIIEHSHKDFDKQFLRSSDAHCRNIFSHQLHL